MEPGTWWWSKSIARPVKVQEILSLWGTTTIRVIDGAQNLMELPPDDLRPLDAGSSFASGEGQITHVASGARLDHHLNQPDTLSAQLTPSLQPLPHQLQHLHDALTKPETRLLVADEVGLGKTITAGLILTELANRGRATRILVLTPAGLVAQWIQEMRRHFNLELTPVFTELMATPETGQVWTQFNHVITSYDAVKPVDRRRGWSREEINAFNANRHDAMIEAGWDVVVIDEAHRMAGGTVGVARNALATNVAGIAPHLLLLTGTPHQGKLDQFHRLVRLLDADAFSTPDTVTRENLARYVLRTDKKNAVTMDGDALFVDRATHLASIPETVRSAKHHALYAETTEYIRNGYAAAEKDNRSGIGFLMVLVQRRLASSTDALVETLQTRLSFLQGGGAKDARESHSEEFEETESDIHDESIREPSSVPPDEIKTLKRLLALAKEVQVEGPDPKAEYLLDLLRRLQQLEHDPAAKFLIFTEFLGTQGMLASYLERHGYKVTTLNGSMGLDERAQAQAEFRGEAQILISTEAGGEGLNLQFAHLVINFDLPWNPMRVEQRIGRVHRIGQKKPVSAYNLVLGGTVEHRVVEVYGEKLERILRQLGIDKLSDVLDTQSIDGDMQRLYRDALNLKPDRLESEIDEALSRVREQAKVAKEAKQLASKPLDLPEIKRRLSKPAGYWLAQFAKTSPTPLKADLRDPGTRTAIRSRRPWAPGEPVPVVGLPQLPRTVSGSWSLWRVGIRDDLGNSFTRYHPLLEAKDGALLGPSATSTWDALIDGSFQTSSTVHGDEAKKLLDRAHQLALQECRKVHAQIVEEHKARLKEDRERHEHSIRARRAAIQEIGLPEVRQHRTRKLDAEHEAWQAQQARRERLRPILELILLAQIQGGAP